MTKLEKIEIEAQKAREKIAAIQAQLKQIDGQRTEQENLQIIQQVRALKLSREELYTFINGGELPASLAGAVDTAPEPETIYSRQNKTNYDTKNYESEDIENEDEEE
jgi:hypothetical protein